MARCSWASVLMLTGFSKVLSLKNWFHPKFRYPPLSISPQTTLNLAGRETLLAFPRVRSLPEQFTEAKRHFICVVVYHKQSCEGNMCEYLDRMSGRASGAKISLSKVGLLPASEYVFADQKALQIFWGGVFGDLTLWNSWLLSYALISSLSVRMGWKVGGF